VDGIVLDTAHYFSIHHNLVDSWDHSNVQLSRADHNDIYNNKVTNDEKFGGRFIDPGGVNEGSDYNKVYYNYVVYTGDGSQIASGDNNVIYANVWDGACTENDSPLCDFKLSYVPGLMHFGGITTSAGVQNNYFVNNVMYMDSNPSGPIPGYCFSFYSHPGDTYIVDNNHIENNICWYDRPDDDRAVFIQITDNPNYGTQIFRNNMFYWTGGAPAIYNYDGEISISSWNADETNIVDNNLNDDPEWTDAANGDFTLQGTSHCIDSGYDVGVDYANVLHPNSALPLSDVTTANQDNYGSDWEIGAYVFTGGTPTYECSDGSDNDGDGDTDYPSDSGCASDTDDDETDCGDGVCEGGETFSICSSDCSSPQQNPIAHYKFDEGLGTIATDSEGDNDGIINGATWTTGKFEGALDFDGIEDSVSIANFGDIFSQGGTVSVWINMASFGSYNSSYLLSQFDGQGWIFFVVDSFRDRSLVFRRDFDSSNGFWASDNVLNVGEWVHVAVTYDGSSVGNDPVLYVNGQAQVLSDDNNPVGSPISLSSDLVIGRHLVDDDRFFDGAMDDVRIYNRVLNSTEIFDLFNSSGSSSSCSSGADGDSDDVVSISELINFISDWKNGIRTINELISGISEWKSGC